MTVYDDGSFQQVQQALIAQGESNQPILIIAKPGDRGPMRAARAWAGQRSGSDIALMRQTLISYGYQAEELERQYGDGAHGLHAFRAPHFTISRPALVGRRANSSAPWKHLGEYQLAFNGVLFLDEVPEFPKGHLMQLKEQLETQNIGVRVVGVVYTRADKQDYSDGEGFVSPHGRNPDDPGTQNGAWTFADLFNPVVIDTTGFPWVKSVLGKWMKPDTAAPRKLLYLFDD